MTSRSSLFVVVLVATLGLGCGNDNPIAPGFAPAPAAPELTCPADITETGVTGLSRAVTYSPPSPSGGHPPVTSSCAPDSGSVFPLGTSLVTCNAQDSLGQRRTCSFNVTLAPLRISAMRFVAFGDSLTEGENGNSIDGPCPQGYGVQCVDAANSYPTRLAKLLRDEFPTQEFTVVNAGIGGRRAEDDVARLPGVLAPPRPDALLLLHGFNDLLRSGDEAVTEVIRAQRDMIRIAKQSGVRYVFVSTLVPSGPGFRKIDPQDIRDVNDGLRVMVPAEGAVLVDTYALFLGREGTLVSPDGLHLTPAGNQVLAESFYAAIRATIPAAQLQGSIR